MTAVDDALAGIIEDSSNHLLHVLQNDLADPPAELTILSVDPPDRGGIVLIRGGTDLLYRPAPNYAGLETFGYTVTDGRDQDHAAVTVQVDAVNDAPVIRPRGIELTKTFEFHGQSAGDRLGHSVDLVEDVNGDGFKDLVVGAPGNDGNGYDSGAAYLVSSADGRRLYRLEADGPRGEFGGSVSAAGDVDGDGIRDVIVGAPKDDHAGHDNGSAYVFSGADGSTLHAVHGQAYNQLGTSVAAAGDVNADGFGDFVIGAPIYVDEYGDFPTVQVFSGRDGSVLHTLQGGIGSLFVSQFGQAVAGVGDVNGDGAADIAVARDDRAIVIYSGTDGSVLRELIGPAFGKPGSRSFGAAISADGDVDGDGVRDLVAGAPGSDRAFVFSGADGQLLRTLHGEGPDSEFAAAVAIGGDLDGDGLADLFVGAPGDDRAGEDAGSVQIFSGNDGTRLATLYGDSAHDRFGQSVAGADINGDGLGDLLVGVPRDDKTGIDSGSVWLFTSSIRSEFELPPAEVARPSPGQTVASLLADMLDDPDENAVGGIAIQSASGDGHWQFSLDQGRTYVDVATVDPMRSLLLRDVDLIRYVASSDRPERAEVTFVGWDQTTGEAGQRVDTRMAGGATSFSADSATARIRANDASLVTRATHLTQWHTYTEDNGIVQLDDIAVQDEGEHDQVSATLALSDIGTGVLTASSGNGEVYDHQTGLWTLTGSVDQVNAALADVAFRPAADGDRSTIIAVLIQDADVPDATARGRIILQATPVNDAPELDWRMRKTVLRWEGEGQWSSGYGGVVRGGGDVNADGFDDLIVGGASLDVTGVGTIQVRSGLDFSPLLTVRGDGVFGQSASFAGDVNGDGRADLVVGSPADDTNGKNAGRVDMVSGADGTILYRLLGQQPGDHLGHSVSGLDDINGDGYSDFVVGVLPASGVGTVQVHSGVDDSLLFEVSGDSNLFGFSVSGVGDANGDGWPDFVVGDPASGVAVLYSGGNRSRLQTLVGAATDSRFGFSVGAAGDVNRDGLADVIVGAPWGLDASGSQTGVARVFSGKDGRLLQSIEGESGGDGFGWSVGGAGDFDRDGTADLLVAEPGADNNGEGSGSIHVFSGADGSSLFRADGDSPIGLDLHADDFGASVSAGDFNGDGWPDLVAGAPWDDGSAGTAWVFLSPQSRTLDPAAVLSASGSALQNLLLDGFTDADSDPVGYAIHQTTGAGTWQFSLDAGRSFHDIGQVDPRSARLLRGQDRVRYLPGQQEAAVAAIELVGWDQTAGAAGTKADAATRGGSTAFSVDSATAYLPIVGLNRPPHATNLDQTHTYAEGSESVPLAAIVVTDDDPGEEIVVTLALAAPATGVMTAASGHGEQYDEASGIWSVRGSVEQVNAALAAVAFQPTMNNDRDTWVDVSIADAGEDQARPATGKITLKVTPINDAPVLRTLDVRTLHGDDHSRRFGHSVSTAGDVNGDGSNDIIVGAQCHEQDGVCRGSAYVFSGADQSLLYRFDGRPGDFTAATVAGAGDVNGDGRADVIVGSANIRSQDHVQVYSGADGSELASLPAASAAAAGDVNGDRRADLVVSNPQLQVYSGADGSRLPLDFQGSTTLNLLRATADGAGDIDGDGRDDIVVGVRENSGYVLVFSGADASVLLAWQGDARGDQLGNIVRGVGDVNGDGVPDIGAVANQLGNGGNGYVRVFSGVDGNVLYTFHPESPDQGFGLAMGPAGDVNGDALADVIVGNQSAGIGQVTVLSGPDGSILSRFVGSSENDSFAAAVDGAGDVNADGLGDLIVGAPQDGRGSVAVLVPVGARDFSLDRIGQATRDERIGDLMPGLLSDVDSGAVEGIAVRGATGNGTWQYSIDQGQTFHDFGPLDVTRSLLLRETDRIRYIPAAGPPRPASLQFVGWDQSTGTAGTRVNSAVTGGTTAFSSRQATAQVNLVDIPPSRLAPGDANADFRFDQRDIVRVLQSAKYLTGLHADWSEGDFNGDGVFDQLDILTALQAGNFLQGPYETD